MTISNQIYLRRKNKINIVSGKRITSNEETGNYVATILKNIESYGYTMSKEIIDVLNTYSIGELRGFYFSLVSDIQNMLGTTKNYNPMYPNFPSQVMDASESELYVNAIIHYWSLGDLLPVYDKEERFPLFDATKFTIINLGNKEDFRKIFSNLLQSKTSISETDKEDLAWFVSEYKNEKDFANFFPEVIPLKENVALFSKLILENKISETILYRYFKTATDVLRLAVSMSDGDISLAANTRFRSFKRAERRLLLSLLTNCNNIEEDMKRYVGQWIRLGERLHPSEYRTSYLKAQQAFYKIRNNVKIETFNGKIDEAIKTNNFSVALELLKQRSGEFARNLDHMLRIHPSPNVVVNEFKSVSDGISTPVLLQLSEHFKHRHEDKVLRVFFPKGSLAKVYGLENNLTKIDNKICESIVKISENSLVNKFKEKDFLGNVYVDEQLKNYLVPFSQRSASKALKTIVRGSKMDIPEETNTIRSFIYWKQDKHDRVDIDLSAVMYDEDWNYLEHVSYTNLRSSRYNACHSGDITSAPNGASEFIDLDINSVQKYGGRYIILSMYSFTDQPYVDLPECFVGWMFRECPNSGEIYEPKTVVNKADITANTQICIPIIIDLFDRKVIWTDISLSRQPNHNNSVEANKNGLVLMGKALTTLVKPNLYDLIQLHVKARGISCDNKEDADIVFSLDEGVTPFDFDVISSEYL